MGGRAVGVRNYPRLSAPTGTAVLGGWELAPSLCGKGVAKTSTGPIPPSFWISMCKKQGKPDLAK